ncbi:hypothetical protein ACQPXH_12490 [Nocardia sp. CA-135953]|uniref:hypothetical protein n=1 Tax=Nocardia sp. CA-135953 TaxID=3239978 RepID=UPI003D9939F8
MGHLVQREVELHGANDLDAASAAAAIAHVGCSNAMRQTTLRRTSVAKGIGATTMQAIAMRARHSDLLLSDPALAHERLSERLGILSP